MNLMHPPGSPTNTPTPPPDWQVSDLVPLREVARGLPSTRGDKPVHHQTVCRWTTHGRLGHRLRYVDIGASRFSTWPWVRAFLEAVTAASAARSGSCAMTSSD